MNRSPMAFLFLDECMYEPLDMVALTGVLVPLESYSPILDEMCQLAWEVLSPEPNVVPAPIEFHGRSLPPELSGQPCAEADKARLHVFARVVSIVNTHRLRVFRVAYFNRREIAAPLMHPDSHREQPTHRRIDAVEHPQPRQSEPGPCLAHGFVTWRSHQAW